MSQEQPLITVNQLAERLGISPQTLYQWTCARKIPFVKIGRTVRFDVAEIERWLDAGRVPEGAPKRDQ